MSKNKEIRLSLEPPFMRSLERHLAEENLERRGLPRRSRNPKLTRTGLMRRILSDYLHTISLKRNGLVRKPEFMLVAALEKVYNSTINTTDKFKEYEKIVESYIIGGKQ